MRYKPCDELAVNIVDAQKVAERKTGLPCRLNLAIAETLISEVAERYESDMELEPLLDAVLRANFIGTDEEPERTGYKCMLGKFFGARARYEREKTESMIEHYAPIAFSRR